MAVFLKKIYFGYFETFFSTFLLSLTNAFSAHSMAFLFLQNAYFAVVSNPYRLYD